MSVPEYGGRGNRQGSISARELRGDTRSRKHSGWSGVLFLALLVLVVGGGALVVLGPVYKDFAFNLAKGNPQALKLPMVPDIVKERLGDELRIAAGSDDTPTDFTVAAGQSIAQIGQALTDKGFIAEPLVFAYQVVTRGLDDQLQVGTFKLNKAMTPADIAERLAQPPDPQSKKVVLGFRVSLRLEQMAAYLEAQKTKGLKMDVNEFLDLVQNPPQELIDDYPALKQIPKGRSLEGFMGQGTFEVDQDISPEGLVRLLLDDWQKDIGMDVLQQAKKAGMDPYEVITLASLVERETGDDNERPKIAGVYLNRLDPSLNPTEIMNADPTVIYAVDTMALRKKDLPDWTKYLFWDTVDGSLAKVKVPDDLSSFQTYQNPGLPDGPIATPTLASIQAVLNADTKSGNLFFYACPGAKTHKFAQTLAEQQDNIRSCPKVKPTPKPGKTQKP
ncbi:MAG: endolytic transglycosylase MltG [Chloroflexota bacterium]